MMMTVFNWFQLAPVPSDALSGTYNLKLVALSYLIAVLASYVALDFVGRLRAEKNAQAKLYWLFGGAFAMGAGIWSMHFIGMLAFIMPMAMGYNLPWTSASLIVAILASGFALYILREEKRKTIDLIISGILIGLAIATMHYMGMEGMMNHVNIRYQPSLFFLSIGIAIFAAEAALWLAMQSNQGSSDRQFYLKLISALVMGIAICGMHYTGMAAAIFTPLTNVNMVGETLRPDLLAFFVAGITGLIISLALTVSAYYKRMINAVQNEKEFLNAMLDNLEDGIIACDRDGKITVFNDMLKKYLNISKEAQLSNELSNYFDLFSLNNELPLKREESPLWRALNNERIHALELIMKFKNGVALNVVIDGQSIQDFNGNKLGAVIVIHDITEIKMTEKMKREFVSVVSHELRTPITSIRGSLGLLLGGTIDTFSDKVTKLLDIANRNCERLLLLINDILDMEKIQEGKMNFDLKIVNINEIINEAVVTNKMYCEKFGASIEFTPAKENIEVYADSDRLLQVLANLISNAAKFSPQGGIITLKVDKNSGTVRISIIDQGSGIPIEFQSRIFQKFSQADSSDTRGKGGTGLGLSISKAIIEKMGGSLGFFSKPQEGATFYFDLPMHYINKALVETLRNERLSLNKSKLLICEDDEDQATYLHALLENAGIYSDIANSTKEAKKLLAENTYRALLLDLILPDQDGIAFIRELRKADKTRELPIIVMSMIVQSGQELLNGDAVLVEDWLDKPINFEKLLKAISRIKQNKQMDLPHILHVEDDIDTQHVVEALLEKKARVTSSCTIGETIQKLANDTFDLVILDLLLPDGKGSDLLPVFAKYKLPIIVYSALDLDSECAKYVKQALVKSKISNDQLLSTVKLLLNEKIKDAEDVE